MGIYSKREQGFTLIELLIVGIIVCILATLVAMTYSGVQAKNRNARRQTDIQQVQSQLEIYYAQHSQYPRLAQLNDAVWRAENMKNFKDDMMSDPSWKGSVKSCAAGDKVIFSNEPVQKCYSYQATAADGTPCTDSNVVCAQYTLTTMLEGNNEKYVKSSLN